MVNKLHIIAFDIPFPANYGGAIDVFYRIKSLHEAGVNVILHCFLYNRLPSPELEQYCTKVYYYQRKTGWLNQCSLLPYTVVSRKSPELLQHLLEDDYPIVFEGLMSCYYLNHRLLRGRFKIFREANIEHVYYRALAKAGRGLTYKLYHYVESIKLRMYEKVLLNAQLILAVSETDRVELLSRYPEVNTVFVPCFHAQNSVDIRNGCGDYVLYHGNLSVAENEQAALFLCKQVFSKLSTKCVVAGYKPSVLLRKTIEQFANITLVENPDQENMQRLIHEAHIHTLITFQATGLKLKLLHVLFAGRHVIANAMMIQGTGLDKLCVAAETSFEIIKAIQELMHIPMDEKQIETRKEVLQNKFSNKTLTQQIVNSLTTNP